MKLDRRVFLLQVPLAPTIKVGQDYYNPDDAENVKPGELKAWYKIGRDYLFAVLNDKGNLVAHWHDTKTSCLREYSNFGNGIK